jgi:type II secretory pathway pseudopilin PulG
MASTFTPRQHFNQRDGVTLIEVLLVVGLIVLIASMAMPELLGTLRLQRLRSAADELRTDLSKARNRAMSSGQILGLTLTENSYSIGLASDIVDENEASSTIPLQQQTRTLADGLRLMVAGGQGPVAVSPGGSAVASAVGSDGIAAYFYPDGTTSTIEFQVSDDNKHSLIVSLRGITGVALVQDAPSQNEGIIVAEIPAANGGTTP